jgi:hypothetical protein
MNDCSIYHPTGENSLFYVDYYNYTLSDQLPEFPPTYTRRMANASQPNR